MASVDRFWLGELAAGIARNAGFLVVEPSFVSLLSSHKFLAVDRK